MLEIRRLWKLRMAAMAIIHNAVEEANFNQAAHLPYELRLQDFQMAYDVTSFFRAA
jgi:hypothetical protein